MAENQNIEYKESWRDEYLKWICGFANAQGGKIYIGKRDNGTVLRVKDSKKLLEDIPNKIQNKLGIVIVSNCSMLPFGWTAETLLGSHTSKPYNPDIARVFYRAGYIESWGRGIQKICDACKNLGAEEPEYIVHGEDIMVKFRALESARVTEKVTENLKEDEKKVVEILRKNPYATYSDIADILKISRKTASLKIKALKEKDIIVRVGASKNGYWKFRE